MDRRRILKESLKTLGQSLPRVFGVLAGAGLLHSYLGGRRGKELRVDISGSPKPIALENNQKETRRIAE